MLPQGEWQPPSETERDLYAAKLRGDWPGYFDVLAVADLWHAMPRAFVEANPGRRRYTPTPWGHGPGVLVFLTSGMLPHPEPDPVFFTVDLGDLVEDWSHHDVWLAVNPGSPCEAYFPATPEHRRRWRWHADAAEGHSRKGRLRTLWSGGVLHGPLAHGLACGALLCVANGSFWNAMGWHGRGFNAERRRLSEWWGIRSRQDWQLRQKELLADDVGDSLWETVLGVRAAMARELGGHVEVDHWRQVTEGLLRSRGPDGPAPDRLVAGAQRVIGRITRYEARFRADGLLRPGGFVGSVDAWFYGRAAKMARWGLGARYCSVEEAEEAVLEAGRLSRLAYSSWEAFSAGYVLGRCLHFDDEEFGHWYADMLAAHRTLTTDPDSPWLNIPFNSP
ncbi:DUF1266 domain-containing protein [Nonomuraea longicatena]|uniref:DUF1266 domain-containing protein n=1 Tax=Nonomuraea longicatena TaxID=83682 RepID=A0ABN1PAG4_9ACTN